MSSINTGGLGAVNSVTYTSLNGLDLSASQITDTTTKVQTASKMSGKFQEAVNSLLYQNLNSCALSDLFTASSTPTLAQATTFLQTNLNATVNSHQQLSLDDLKTLKKALDNFGNKEASKLPGNSGGGIKSVNGSFYVNGQEVTIQDVFMAVRVNQLANFEDQINAELKQNLPLLSTTKILMECVKAGMGREAAHEIIRKHATKSKDFFGSLVLEKDFPLTLDQLNSLIENPADFAGNAIEQSDEVKKLVGSKVIGKVSKVELSELR
jgi:hypothetical protein